MTHRQNDPSLMRLYFWHSAIGFVLSAIFVAMLLWYDFGGLATLIGGSDVPIMAVFLLWFFNGTVFGSVQFAIVIMSQAENPDRNMQRGSAPHFPDWLRQNGNKGPDKRSRK